jgi:hypothetical protein
MKTNEAVFHLMDALRAPIITFSRPWADILPERMVRLVTQERLVHILTDKQYAGDVEVVLYMMTYTMEGPPTHEWAEIYFHLTCKVMEQHFQQDHWEEIQAPRELTEYQERYLLQPLRNWIYKKRREALKVKLKLEQLEPEPIDSYKAEDIFTIIQNQAPDNGKETKQLPEPLQDL